MQNTILQSTESMKGDKGKMNGVAYDTAWTARVTNQNGKPFFPECVQWLLNNQKPDGSWGCKTLHYHDRILSTLSAIMALRELYGNKYESYIQRGETYIWKNIKNLKLDDYRLIGSELLFPSLMREAESMGLNLPSNINIYREEYKAKLKKIDESMWYSPRTTLSFSFEFLGDNVDIKKLPNIQLPDGSVGNSPSATAYLLKHIRDPKALQYLREILSLTGNGSVMTVYPIDLFEYGWTVYNLLLAGLYFERYTEICNYMFKNMGQQGAGWSTLFPVPDADDTAVILKVLQELQYPIDPEILNMFYTGEYFLTFVFELDPSVSTNIHVLDFIKDCPQFPNKDEVVEQLIRFIRSEMNSEGFWVDKWHVSPYYPTSHAVLALCDVDPSLASKAISWILDTQNKNGTWGREGGTLEETAYAIQALLYYHRHVEHIDIGKIARALSILNLQNYIQSEASLPEMWVAKVFLTPVRVVGSAVASAQFMARSENIEATSMIP